MRPEGPKNEKWKFELRREIESQEETIREQQFESIHRLNGQIQKLEAENLREAVPGKPASGSKSPHLENLNNKQNRVSD